MPKMDGVDKNGHGDLLAQLPESWAARAEQVSSWLAVLAREAEQGVAWTDEEIMLLRTDSGIDINLDDVPEAPMVPVTRLGDLWLLGKHRLLCGDSTYDENLRIVAGSDKFSMVLTDPPYGVDFKRGQFITDPRRRFKQATRVDIRGDSRKDETQREFIKNVFSLTKLYCLPAATIYMFSASMKEGMYSAIGLFDAGVHVQSQLVWVKNYLVLGQADHHWRHELCWYGWFEGDSHRWFGGRDKTTVLEYNKLSSTTKTHPNEKPVDMLQSMLMNSSLPGDLVYEPFAGSGSTIIACQQTNRRCYAIDIDPMYVDVALQRWANLTGLDPIRESDGARFSELLAAREQEAL